ncbi:hypothetical protein RUND412_007313 [Rhizina undulata]
MPPANTTEDDRLIIAVDFGTTYSGVSWSLGKTRTVINEWPGAGNRTSDKVPTEILYLDLDPTGAARSGPDGKRIFNWGHIKLNYKDKTNKPLKWFKLLLHDQNPFADKGMYERGINDDGLSGYVPEFDMKKLAANLNSNLTLMDENSKQNTTKLSPAAQAATHLKVLKLKPIDVATDYLRALREHVLAVIEKKVGPGYVDRELMKPKYVITVPAIWSDSAKGQTVQAAKNAGYGEHEVDFTLIGEPEAAAAYSIEELPKDSLKEGDTFVICDAGGGTVDLVSYSIDNISPLEVSEVVGGTGDLCGSVFVNQKFEEHVRELLGGATFNNMTQSAKVEMMRQWEDKVKYDFSGDDDKSHPSAGDVFIPGVPEDKQNEIGMEQGYLSFTKEKVKSFFDPVVDRVVALVGDQISSVKEKGKDVSSVLLVGGFGASPYLHKRLKEHSFSGKQVPVLQPPNAWSAITRGALKRGIDGCIVKDQIARRHYGITISLWYQEGKGLEKHRQYCYFENAWKVPNQMQWIVKKKAKIENKQTCSIKVYGMAFKDTAQIATVEILACTQDECPSWKDEKIVFPVCTVEADLSKFPLETLPEYENNYGMKYWKVHFTLEMKVSSGIITFSLNFQGKNYGCAKAKFY